MSKNPAKSVWWTTPAPLISHHPGYLTKLLIPHLWCTWPAFSKIPAKLVEWEAPSAWYLFLVIFRPLTLSPCSLAINPHLKLLYSEISPISLLCFNSLDSYFNGLEESLLHHFNKCQNNFFFPLAVMTVLHEGAKTLTFGNSDTDNKCHCLLSMEFSFSWLLCLNKLKKKKKKNFSNLFYFLPLLV